MAEVLVAPSAKTFKANPPPEEVLADRMAAFAQQSDGVFQVKVWSTISFQNSRMWWLDAVIPEMNGGAQGVLTVHTPLHAPYPAVVDAALFRDQGIIRWGEMLKPLPVKQANWADDADELADIVDRVLRSPPIGEVLQRFVDRVQAKRKT